MSALTCPSFSGTNCVGSATFYSGSTQGSQLALAAAGNNMYVLTRGSDVPVVVAGTSFSAPVVSAIAALVQSKNNKPRTGACTLQHLKNTAFKTKGYGTDPKRYGAGLVDAYSA